MEPVSDYYEKEFEQCDSDKLQASEDHTSLSAKSDSEHQFKADKSLQVQDLFEKFEKFNFNDNSEFQAGLKRITTLHSKLTSEQLLKIKAFYYSKNVEPFDVAAYLKWSQRQGASFKEKLSSEDKESVCTSSNENNLSDQLQLENLNDPTENSKQCDSDNSHNRKEASKAEPHAENEDSSTLQPENTGDIQIKGGMTVTVTSAGDSSQELTFAEIAELIQSGKPIPGLSQIEVVPTNSSPTPSQLPRSKKPWEERMFDKLNL